MSVDHIAESSQYCICKLDVGEIMVYCNNRNCEKGTWFHHERIRMKEDDVTDDVPNIFDKTCGERKLQPSSLGIFQESLYNMVRHNAVKETDGPRVIIHWTFDV